MSEAALTERAVQIITSPPDEEHVAALARAGVYLPAVTATQELAEDRHPLAIEVNYANIAQAATELDMRLPITFNLTTSTVRSQPTITIDRQGPASCIDLPLGVRYASGKADLQRDMDTKFWLSALAARHAAGKSPRRPYDLERPLSERQLRKHKTVVVVSVLGMLGIGFGGTGLGETLEISGVLASGAGGLYSSLRTFSVVPGKNELEKRSDKSAARYLKNPLLRLQAGRLASRYPVLELRV